MTDYVINTIRQAREAGACEKLHGDETKTELLRLFTTPAGLEFACEKHVPTLATMRLFRDDRLEDHGIYLDGGEIELTNPDNAVLAGKTIATVRCSRKRACRVTVMRGAKVAIHAEGWAVVMLRTEKGSTVMKSVKDNAIVIEL